MRNIVTIHQPNYLPWIGLFSKVKKADCFIIADTFPYTCHSITNRNKIKTDSGGAYLTIPINKEFHLARCCDVILPSDASWKNNHWQRIRQNYKEAVFFSQHADFFDGLYHKDFKYLSEINIEIILYLLKCFKIDVEILKSSDLDVDRGLHKTDAIIAVLKDVGAKAYLSGPSGKDYLDLSQFRQSDIGLKYINFQHPVYKQRFAAFIPGMSAIDLLFNEGSDAGAKLIDLAGKIEDFKLLN